MKTNTYKIERYDFLSYKNILLLLMISITTINDSNACMSKVSFLISSH